jgi:hypothetical protein
LQSLLCGHLASTPIPECTDWKGKLIQHAVRANHQTKPAADLEEGLHSLLGVHCPSSHSFGCTQEIKKKKKKGDTMKKKPTGAPSGCSKLVLSQEKLLSRPQGKSRL